LSQMLRAGWRSWGWGYPWQWVRYGCWWADRLLGVGRHKHYGPPRDMKLLGNRLWFRLWFRPRWRLDMWAMGLRSRLGRPFRMLRGDGIDHRCSFTDRETGILWGYRGPDVMNRLFEKFIENISPPATGGDQ